MRSPGGAAAPIFALEAAAEEVAVAGGACAPRSTATSAAASGAPRNASRLQEYFENGQPNSLKKEDDQKNLKMEEEEKMQTKTTKTKKKYFAENFALIGSFKFISLS